MPNTIDQYLSKGMDRKTAEYYAGGRHRPVSVIPNADYTLTIVFDNGERRLFNARPLIRTGTVFESLAEWENYCRVYIDDTHAIAWDIDPTIDSSKVWNNKVDICPDTCYLDSTPL